MRTDQRLCRIVEEKVWVFRYQEVFLSVLASTDAFRVALVISADGRWSAAISDIASAFLLAPWPAELPGYAIQPPRLIRDAGEDESLTGPLVD